MSATAVLLENLQQYQYKPLPTHEKFIRLVIVFPRDPLNPADLRICILPTPLEKARRVWPDYQALSYVWGDRDDRRDLIVLPITSDSDPPEAQLPTLLSVTANLAEAIHYLPYPDKHIVFWIDAICINQDDEAERAQQVTLMSEIYKSASAVYAWLGPPSEDSNLAMNLLHRIGESIDIDETSLEIRPRESSLTRASPMSEDYTRLLCDLHFPIPWDGKEAQALEGLFYRPWFERLWIRQEITLGSHAVLVCGKSSIEWSVFRKAAMLLNQKIKHHEHARYDQWMARTELVSDVCIHARVWLGHLLRQMQKAECGDPRDRVYGILGILPVESRAIAAKIKPDYTKSVVEVYKDLVLAEMEATGRADLLSECFLSVDESAARDWRPSWVPNWSVKREKGLSMNQLCADGQSSVTGGWSVEAGVLQLKGVWVDKVTTAVLTPKLTVDATKDRDPAIPPIIDFIKTICATLDVSPEDTTPYGPLRGSGTTVLEAICYALSGGGHFRDHLSDPIANSSSPSLRDFRHLIRHAQAYKIEDAPTHRPPSPRTNACLTLIVHTVPDRTVFVTGKGYIGVGPATMQPGDEIAVLLGCMRPLVLRPQRDAPDASKACYRIVGPCNAHGLDWGEALLGPLPEDVRLVWSHAGQSPNVGPTFRRRSPWVVKSGGREARDEARSDSEEGSSDKDEAHFSGDEGDGGVGSSSRAAHSSWGPEGGSERPERGAEGEFDEDTIDKSSLMWHIMEPLLQMRADVPSLNRLQTHMNAIGARTPKLGAGGKWYEETVNDPRLQWDFLKTTDREHAWVWRETPLSWYGDNEVGENTMFRRPDAGYFKKAGIELTDIFLV